MLGQLAGLVFGDEVRSFAHCVGQLFVGVCVCV